MRSCVFVFCCLPIEILFTEIRLQPPGVVREVGNLSKIRIFRTSSCILNILHTKFFFSFCKFVDCMILSVEFSGEVRCSLLKFWEPTAIEIDPDNISVNLANIMDCLLLLKFSSQVISEKYSLPVQSSVHSRFFIVPYLWKKFAWFGSIFGTLPLSSPLKYFAFCVWVCDAKIFNNLFPRGFCPC